MAILERLYGRAWEGLTGWAPVLRALDEAGNLPPAAEVSGLRSLSGRTTYRPSDLLSVPEIVALQMTAGLVREVRPIRIGPEQLLALPKFAGEEETLGEEACDYGASLRLPFDTVFLDFSDGRGQPAVLPHAFVDQRSGTEVRTVLYGALLTRLPGNSFGDVALFGSEVLIVVPFGCALLRGGEEVCPSHAGAWRLPAAAPIGYVQFGGEAAGTKEGAPVSPSVVIGDMTLNSRPPGVRPTLGMVHLMPVRHKVFAGVGTGPLAECTLAGIDAGELEPRLGPQTVPPKTAVFWGMVAEGAIVAYQVDMALRVMYLLESANVELANAPVSRQVRRAVERASGKVGIAKVVEIRRSRGRPSKSNGSGREYSHSFERSGGYWHITKGAHIDNPSDPAVVKPCPEWRSKHPHSEICRREYHVTALVNAGPGKPFVPKARKLKGT